MSKQRTRKTTDYDDTEHYGRTPKLKEQVQKRQPRNWKKAWEDHEHDDDLEGDLQDLGKKT